MLRAHGVERIVDVRTIPKSRHNPQFGEDQLAPALEAAGISYGRLESLGGLRRARPDSVNDGWRNASFRGYADYMQTEDFRRGIRDLLDLAEHQTVAIMCAEAVPWRCHRSLVGDALLVRGRTVIDIMTEADARPHALTKFAQVEGESVTYPASDELEIPASE